MVLHRRIIRELRQGWVKYGAMAFLLILSLSLVVSLAGGADTIVNTMESTFQTSHVEDGEFQVHVPLNDSQLNELKDLGAKVEEKFYFDAQSEQGTSLRIFKNRDYINQIKLDEGSDPQNDNEIILEKHLADNLGLSIGDNFVLAGNTYQISGIGSVPDYSNVVKNITDVLSDIKKFSVCFVSTDRFNELTKDNDNVAHEYSYILENGCTHDKVKNYITNMDFDKTKITNPYMKQIVEQLESGKENLTNTSFKYSNLTFFLKANDNQRITSCEDDVAINKMAALVAGVIILLLIAYMLSVFSVHNIEKESAIIGTLYSMGYVKKELIRHFMILPVALTVVSSVFGTVLGFLLIPSKVLSSSNYFSFPKAIGTYPLYLIAFGILMPIIITALVNYFVLNGKLKAEPLKLLRKEKKQTKIANVDLKNMGFINRYRIRQLIREIRGNITLFFGLFIAILLMMLGFCIFGSIDNYVNGITKDVNYQYQYILSYPMQESPPKAEIAYTKGLNTKFDLTGGDMGVTLQGIEKDNVYFDFDVKSENNEVFISDSAALKFNWKIGDSITLEDTTANRSYKFKVKDVVHFANGLYIFMDINNMRKVFDQKEGYFNTLLSEDKLDLESGRIASVITKNEMEAAAHQMYAMMSDMIVTIVAASVVLFVIVMYLLLKMMIDKATFSISLIKVFGYSQKEVKKLYLGCNLYTVLITTLISLPITKKIISMIYPSFISNVSAGMPTVMPVYLYLIMIGIIMGSYLLVNVLLSRHLKKVSLVEILKERE
ncbi:ABC transporter permease [[Clostridium] fimetarium]|uniref:Putative ABC transport system permease protein n=1 Tax=[Clostridium] fimetarium TaxID=99656 RepID=A0A1I0PVE2_9FIRM|nr:ABC transporter permease [[Clostridium] fimetarium]SEW18201.1 putative ABC transport system permease protein [[Clostridium] fimetarium]